MNEEDLLLELAVGGLNSCMYTDAEDFITDTIAFIHPTTEEEEKALRIKLHNAYISNILENI